MKVLYCVKVNCRSDLMPASIEENLGESSQGWDQSWNVGSVLGENPYNVLTLLWTSDFQLLIEAVHLRVPPSSGTLAWKIPGTEEPGRLQSMGLLRIGHDWAPLLSLFTFMHWRTKWQPTPVFLPGESQEQRSLVGCRLWGRTQSDTTEATQQPLLVMKKESNGCP